MRWLLTLAVLVMSIVLGYISFLTPYNVLMLNPNKLTVLGDADVIESKCLDKTESSYCAKKYLVNLKEYENKYSNLSVGVGTILYATRYFCDDLNLNFGYDDFQNPGKSYSMFSTYQTVDLAGKRCSVLSVEAWVRNEAVRKGRIGGLFVVGEKDTVEQVKKLSEFFSHDMSQIFLFCFVFLFIISNQVKNSLIDLKTDFLDASIFWWLLCAVSNSGLIQLFFPYGAFPALNNKLDAVFILMAFSLPYIFNLTKDKKTFKVIEFVLFVILISLMIRNEFSKYFAISLILVSFLGMVSTIVKYNFELLQLSIILVASTLKINGISHMPNAMIVYYYIGLTSLVRLYFRLRVASNFSKMISYCSKLQIRPEKVTEEISNLIAMAIKLTGVVNPTILRILPDSQIKIYRFFGEKEEFFPKFNYSLFTHHMSLKKECWHMQVGSEEYKRIKQIGNDIPLSDEYITIIPIFDEEKMYGALGFTGYSQEYIKDNELSIEQKAIVGLLKNSLKTLMKVEDNAVRSTWVQTILHLTSAVLELSREPDDPQFRLNKVTEIISSKLECSVYVAELDIVTRKFTIHGISGFDSAVKERFIRGNLYAHLENEQGPLALAVNKKQPVIVSDVRLIKDVIHENTVLFFEKNRTLSCAGIPIYFSHSHDVWGILWIERREGLAPLSALAEKPLIDLSKSISQYIELQDKEKIIIRTTDKLKQFVPENVFESYFNYGQTEERDYGYMVIIDLKGSTKIALEKGSAFWLEAVKKVIPEFKSLTQHYGLKFHEFKWDLFIFTMTSNQKSYSEISKIFQFYSRIACILEHWYEEEFSLISLKNRETGQKARCCVTFGDTSRGFSDGITKAWGIVGSEIAAVIKMEDVCKKLEGVFFIDDSSVHESYISDFIDSRTIVPGTGRRIYCHRSTWWDLVRDKVSDAA